MCSTIHKEQFTYYSFDFNEIEVDSQKMLSRNNGMKFDADICEKCYDNARTKIMQNLKSHQNGKISCDFCSIMMSGAFIYYKTYVHKVSVDKNVNPPTLVSKNVLDINVDSNCFKGFNNSVLNSRLDAKKKGDWS